MFDLAGISFRDLLRHTQLEEIFCQRLMTVMENILLPAKLYGKNAPAEEVRQWMDDFEIDHLADAMPRELSGGELRRMAIIRALVQNPDVLCALVQNPDVLFADEPTGDLDDENTEKVLSALSSYAHDQKKAVFIVTHENDALKYADRIFRMEKGQIDLQENQSGESV